MEMNYKYREDETAPEKCNGHRPLEHLLLSPNPSLSPVSSVIGSLGRISLTSLTIRLFICKMGITELLKIK